jgi:hypothetical protein
MTPACTRSWGLTLRRYARNLGMFSTVMKSLRVLSA